MEQEYYIVSRIELVDGKYTQSQIGHVTTTEDRDKINQDYDSTLGAWIKENIDGLQDGSIEISEYFNEDDVVFSAKQVTNYVDKSIFGNITGLF